MKYPIAIDSGNLIFSFGVVVPDLPGCFSAGDTYQEALVNVLEAIEMHITAYKDAGNDIPEAKSIDHYKANPEFEGWDWDEVDVGFLIGAS